MFYQLFHKSQREEGQGLVEYSLLITLVALAVTMILLILGDTIEQQFCAVRNELLMVGDPNQTCDSAVVILMINDQGPNTINMEAEVSDPNGDPDDPYATISKVEFYIDEDSGSPVQTEYFYRHCLSGNPSGQPCGNYDLSGLDSGQHTVIAKVYLEDDTVTTSQIGFTK